MLQLIVYFFPIYETNVCLNKKKMSGLVNPGTTCYRNAVLQLMRYAPGLWRWMKSVPHKTAVCTEIRLLFDKMDESTVPINPVEFNALVDKNPTFTHGIGADAAEFMKFLSLNLDRDSETGWLSLELKDFRKIGIFELLQTLESIDVPMVTVHIYRHKTDDTVLTDSIEIPDRITVKGKELRLHGVISHIGKSVYSGHFRTLIKGAFGNWVSYNDTAVRPFKKAPEKRDECVILVAYVPSENYCGSVFSHLFGASARRV